MGMIMTEANRPQIGEYHYRRVLDLSGQRDPILLANLAWNLKNQGRMEEARALYQESAAAAPDIRQTLLGFARLEEADRNFDAAEQVLDSMEQRFPNDPAVRLTRAVLLGRQRKYDEALALIDSTISGDARLGPNELLEKGRLLDQLGRYDDAWAAFAEGKRLARELSGQVYLDAAAQQQIDRLRTFFTCWPAAADPARQGAVRCAAADLHPRLPALRHHAGGTDAVGAPEDRRRRRAAADPRDHRHHAAHAGQSARLSGGAGRTLDGRPARGSRQSARLLFAEGPPDGRAAPRRRRASPTRCR